MAKIITNKAAAEKAAPAPKKAKTTPAAPLENAMPAAPAPLENALPVFTDNRVYNANA